MKKYISIVLILVGVMMFQGCGPKTMTNTLFDVNSEYDEEGDVNTIKQTRIMTVNPLASIEEVGQVCFLDPKRGSETAIYLKVGLNAQKVVKSYIDKDYDSAKKRDALMKIRDSLLKVDRATIELVQKNNELLNLKLYRDMKELNISNVADKTLEKITAKLNESKETAPKEKEEQKTDTKEKEKEETATANKKEDTKVDEIADSLRGDALSAVDQKIIELENNITTLTNKMNGQYDDLLKELNQSNAIIFRWSVEKEKKGFAKLAQILGISGKSKKSLSGFVLASGVKTERLVLGKDLVDSMDNNISEFFKPSTGVITYTVSARDMIFVNKNDLSTMFGMDMDLKFEDLAGNSAAILQKIDKLKLHIATTSVENGLSGGYLSEPTTVIKSVKLPKCEIDRCSKEDTCTGDDNTSVFFAVYTKLSELNRLFK